MECRASLGFNVHTNGISTLFTEAKRGGVSRLILIHLTSPMWEFTLIDI